MTTVAADKAGASVIPVSRNGGVFVDVSTYEASAVADGTFIQMLRIGAGVTVLGVELHHDALGASVVLDVGYGEDADTYDLLIDGGIAGDNAAGVIRSGAGAVIAAPILFTTEDTLDVRVVGAAATGTITLVAYLTTDDIDIS